MGDLTYEKSANEDAALSEGSEHLRLALDAGRMGTWDWDVASNKVTWSASLEAIHGLAPGTFEGTFEAFQKDVHPDDMEVVLGAVTRALKETGDHHVEYRIVRPDGTIRWVEGRGRLFRDQAGNPKRMIGVCIDVTDRTLVEQALRARARQQQAVAELGELALRDRNLQRVLDTAVTTVARTLDIELCKVLELMLGGKEVLLRAGVGWKEGLVGRAKVSTEQNSQAGYTLLTNAPVIVSDLRTEQRFSGPWLLLQHEVVSGMSCIIRRTDGTPWGVLGAHSTRSVAFSQDDISFLTAVANIVGYAIERQQAEEALRASEERFRSMANSTPAMIWTADADGTITFHNRRWLDYTGLTPEQNARDWPALVLHPDDLDRCMQEWTRALKEGTDYEIEVRNRGRDGEYRWFLTRALPIRDADGRIVEWYGSTSDIHERKQAEERQKLLLDELNHRVKNTLAIIQSIAAQTLRRTTDPKAFKQAFSARIAALARAHSLLSESLWSGARMQDIVAVTVSPFQGERTSHPVRFAGPEIWVRPNAAVTLCLLLHELATNAAKHGALRAEQGKVHISWKVSEDNGKPGSIDLLWREQGGPAVEAPNVRGFGSRLIQASADQLGGTATLNFEPRGVECQLRFSAQALVQSG